MDPFYAVGFEKYNHAHDERGRFASGGVSLSGEFARPNTAGPAATSDAKNREVAARIEPSKSIDGGFQASYFAPPRYPGDRLAKFILTYREDNQPSYGVSDEEVHAIHVDATYALKPAGEMVALQGNEWKGAKSAKDYYVDWIETNPDHRRRGLGTAMVEFARRHAGAEVSHSISLTNDGAKFTQVVKYNHNHDHANGKFSSGGGFTINWDNYKKQSLGGVVYPAQAQDFQQVVSTAENAILKTVGSVRAVQIDPTTHQHMIDTLNGMANAVGVYSAANPGHILINEMGKNQSFFLVHEYGHLLDAEVFKGRSKFATGDPNSSLSPVMDLVVSSPSAKRWKYGENGAYWGNHQEMFARAFSQWVATRSGDPVLLKSLSEQMVSPGSKGFPASEFAPIGQAFDEVFGRNVTKSLDPFYMVGFEKYNHSHDPANGKFSSGGVGSEPTLMTNEQWLALDKNLSLSWKAPKTAGEKMVDAGHVKFAGTTQFTQPEQASALRAYASEYTSGINGALRSGETNRYVAGMDAAIRDNVASEPFTVYRGVAIDGGMNMRVGDVMTSPSYMSTSLWPGGTTLFSSIDGIKRGPVFRIHAPKGTNYVTGFNAHENEIVLARNTKLRIVGSYRNPNGEEMYDANIVPENYVGKAMIQKYNHSHDPSNGEFSSGGGLELGVVPGTEADAAIMFHTGAALEPNFHEKNDFQISQDIPRSLTTLQSAGATAFGPQSIPPIDMMIQREQAAMAADGGPRWVEYSKNGLKFSARQNRDTFSIKVSNPKEMPKAVNDMVYFGAVSALSRQWNIGSNEGPMAQALQEAARGLNGGAGISASSLLDGVVEPQHLINEYLPFAKEYVKATYAHTQKILASKGVSAIQMYRGLSLKTDFSSFSTIGLKDRPLSSWSSSQKVGRDFAMDTFKYSGEKLYGTSITKKVSAKDIFSIGGYGPGAISENEFIVLASGDMSPVRIDRVY